MVFAVPIFFPHCYENVGSVQVCSSLSVTAVWICEINPAYLFSRCGRSLFDLKQKHEISSLQWCQGTQDRFRVGSEIFCNMSETNVSKGKIILSSQKWIP